MLPRNHPDRIQITFDDRRLVANAGLLLPATLSRAERKRTSGVSTSSDYVRVMDQRLCQWLLCQANSYPVR